MTRQEFIDWAISKGWKMDRYGHLQKILARGIVKNGETTATRLESNTYRYKLSRIAVRLEVKTSSGWVRLHSGFFSKLSIDPETSHVTGMKR